MQFLHDPVDDFPRVHEVRQSICSLVAAILVIIWLLEKLSVVFIPENDSNQNDVRGELGNGRILEEFSILCNEFENTFMTF